MSFRKWMFRNKAPSEEIKVKTYPINLTENMLRVLNHLIIEGIKSEKDPQIKSIERDILGEIIEAQDLLIMDMLNMLGNMVEKELGIREDLETTEK